VTVVTDPKFVPFWDEQKTIPQLLEAIVEDMCHNYCKYPDNYDEEAEGIELSESEICANCPLNRLT
jgi:hypothetical protein